MNKVNWRMRTAEVRWHQLPDFLAACPPRLARPPRIPHGIRPTLLDHAPYASLQPCAHLSMHVEHAHKTSRTHTQRLQRGRALDPVLALARPQDPRTRRYPARARVPYASRIARPWSSTPLCTDCDPAARPRPSWQFDGARATTVPARTVC